MEDPAILQCHFDRELILLNYKFKEYILNLRGQFFGDDFDKWMKEEEELALS